MFPIWKTRCVGSSPANPLSSADLAAFVTVMEIGTVQGAADALELTPSAVTKRVQSLEQRLGAALFTRGRMGMRSTSAGQALYPEAKTAVAALEAAQAAVDAQVREHPRAVQLAASQTISEYLLPGWLADFRAANRHVRLHVDVTRTQHVLTAVREGPAEIGFVEGADRVDDLETVVLHRDQLVAVVSAGHRWARRRSLRAAELNSEPYLARETGSGTRAVADLALARAGITLEPALQVSSNQSLLRGLTGGGFTIVSELAIADQSAEHLRALPIRDVDLGRALRAIRRHPVKHQLNPDSRVLWRWLQQLAERASVL